ncbi:DHH family protein [Pseudomonas yamanorum]|uniref:DHH family protein n=1 Tax=Pseudomonas yamanorum TaxID=515393 RepID=A0AAJ3H827_9PSED|nr:MULTISPECIES: DHH family protein [Pseudomonas]MDR0192136.1 DHH family protein [Pseudomonas yamanorum]NWD45408.1 DHH family protein [Pseudomonas yamanorum]
MRVVTSGSAYLDIDAYACCIAYAELLNRQGVEARAVSSAPLNASISRTVLGWPSSLDDYRPEPGDEFVLVDISDFHHFDPVVVLDQVVEVIDHHPGFETYWAQKLGPHADIRSIGAAATQVFLRWEAAGLLPLISEHSAALLATAILDNTLNFSGQLTTPADVRAYENLALRAKLAVDWPERYFHECQATIESDLTGALAGDMKWLKADSKLPQVFAQMTVWDAGALIRKHHSTMVHWLAAQGEDWLVNIISIRECKSYFLAEPKVSQEKVSQLLAIDWQAGMAVLERSLLRKELVRLAATD